MSSYSEANIYAMGGNVSAKTSLKLAEQMRDINVNTLGALKDQGKQIDGMQNDMDSFHNNMRQSERKLRGIESVFGSVANKITSSHNSRYKKKAKQDRELMKKRKSEEEKLRKEKQTQWKAKKEADKSAGKVKRDKMLTRAPGTRDGEHGSQESYFYQIMDDTEVQLGKLVGVLDDIKNISMEMHIELDEHLERLDALGTNVNKAIPRVDSAIKRSEILLRR